MVNKKEDKNQLQLISFIKTPWIYKIVTELSFYVTVAKISKQSVDFWWKGMQLKLVSSIPKFRAHQVPRISYFIVKSGHECNQVTAGVCHHSKKSKQYKRIANK